jgi:hypothetical protein
VLSPRAGAYEISPFAVRKPKSNIKSTRRRREHVRSPLDIACPLQILKAVTYISYEWSFTFAVCSPPPPFLLSVSHPAFTMSDVKPDFVNDCENGDDEDEEYDVYFFWPSRNNIQPSARENFVRVSYHVLFHSFATSRPIQSRIPYNKDFRSSELDLRLSVTQVCKFTKTCLFLRLTYISVCDKFNLFKLPRKCHPKRKGHEVFWV